ncbi:MAG: ATP-binding protein [Methanosarcinaceae archaeon]|nr:ATP-binding protein [Methanosarcinaceae archaeon]
MIIYHIAAVAIVLIYLSTHYLLFIHFYVSLTVALILLTGLWYGLKSIYLATFLSIIIAVFEYITMGTVTMRSFGYATTLLIIAFFVSMVYEHRLICENNLKDTSEKLTQVIQGAPIPIFIINKNHEISYWNNAMELLTGIYAFRVINTKNQTSIFNEENEPVLADLIVDGVNGKELHKYYDGELKKIPGREVYEIQTTKTINGIDRFVMIVASPIKDANMDVVGAIQTIYDLTEQKKAEYIIYQAEKDKEWRESFDSIDEPVIVQNRDLIIIQINKAAENIENIIGGDGVIGKNCYALFSELNKKQEETPAMIALKTKKPAIKNIDFSHIGLGTYSFKSTPVLNKSNEVKKIITVTRDITKELQMENEKEKVMKELEFKNKELEDFTHTISHDFKSPLITIEGFANMLKDNLSEMNVNGMDENMDYLNFISNSANKMRHMMDETLKLSKMGKFVSPPKEIPYDNIIQEAMDFMHGEIVKNEVEISKAKNLPIVCVDKIRIIELLTNLIGNSIKYSKKDEKPMIEIGHIINDKSNESSGYAIFYVKDNGIGISKKNQEQVFELFYQTSDDNVGSGAGMAIVRKIVESHGGKVWVESEINKGTTIFYTLPIKSDGKSCGFLQQS